MKVVHRMLEGDQKICMRISFNILECGLILFERIILIMESNEFKSTFFCKSLFLCLYTGYEVQHRNTLPKLATYFS